jgi:N-carbamoyl-L-amino-acid hydrolase
MEMAKIGPGVAGGNNRQTLTDEDAKAATCSASGANRRGSDGRRHDGQHVHARAKAPIRMRCRSMSALTSTPSPPGGKYDGVLGVLAGLEIIRTLNDLDIKTKHPIVVVNWTNEEGTRFAPRCWPRACSPAARARLGL